MRSLTPAASMTVPLALGVAIGVATHNLALWLCIGVAMGVALAGAARRRGGPRP